MTLPSTTEAAAFVGLSGPNEIGTDIQPRSEVSHEKLTRPAAAAKREDGALDRHSTGGTNGTTGIPGTPEQKAAKGPSKGARHIEAEEVSAPREGEGGGVPQVPGEPGVPEEPPAPAEPKVQADKHTRTEQPFTEVREKADRAEADAAPALKWTPEEIKAKADRAEARAAAEAKKSQKPPAEDEEGGEKAIREEEEDERPEATGYETSGTWEAFKDRWRLFVGGDGTIYLGGRPTPEAMRLGTHKSWSPKRIKNQIVIDNEGAAKKINISVLNALIENWIEEEVEARAGEIKEDVMGPLLADEAEEVDKLLRELIRRRFAKNENEDLAFYGIKEIIYQTKRNMIGLPISYPMMLFLYGKGQGGGKSALLDKLLEAIEGLYRDATVTQLVDERNHDVWKANAIKIDEINHNRDHKALGELKLLITANRSYRRVMKTNNNATIFHRATMYAASNYTLAQIGWADSTGARRFLILYYRSIVDKLKDRPTPEEEALVDNFPFHKLWRIVDPRGPSPIFSRPEVVQLLVERQSQESAANEVEAWFKGLSASDADLIKALDDKWFISSADLWALFEKHHKKSLGYIPVDMEFFYQETPKLAEEDWFFFKQGRKPRGGPRGWTMKPEHRPQAVAPGGAEPGENSERDDADESPKGSTPK